MPDRSSTLPPGGACPRCGADVPAGVCFCGACGARLPDASVCPTCSAPLRTAARFCGACGAPIGAGAPTPAAVAPPRSRGGRSSALALALIGVLIVSSLGGGVWVVRRYAGAPPTPAADPTAAVAPTSGAVEKPPDLARLRPPDLTPIPVTRGALMAEVTIDATAGERVATADGLALVAPPGSLDRTRTVKIYAAQVPAPDVTLAIPGAESGPAVLVRAWQIDPGPEDGFFPEAVEVAITAPPTAASGDQATAVLPAIAIDGKRWTFPPYEVRDGALVFRTRHFSEIGLFSWTVRGAFVAKAVAIGLPLVFLGYIVYNRADELPECCHQDAPFTSLGADERGWEVEWSHKIPFKDAEGYRRKFESILSEYEQFGGGGASGALALRGELEEARREFLTPDRVRPVEEALALAKEYIESRGFVLPGGRMRVYVLPEIERESAVYYNPWLGRPYTFVGLNWDRNDIYSAVLHEFFHFYQSGYVGYERMCDAPLLEASALLLEREARDFYQKRGLKVWTDIARLDVYRDGLDGPDCSVASIDPTPVQRHGYGLSWFLEYLRDERYSGDQAGFHAALLREWSRRGTGALHKGLAWAAGGSDFDLGLALHDFAQRYVLRGMKSRTPYEIKYQTPMFSTPYAVGTLNLAANPVYDIDDTLVKAWSIQFFDLQPPGRPKTSLIISVPQEWFDGKPGRSVFVRTSEGDRDASAFRDLPAARDGAIALPFDADRYLYVVDTGQTGSGWVFANQPALVYVLEPPGDVQASLTGNHLSVSWEPPPLARGRPELILEYAVYLGDAPKPLARVGGMATSAEIDLPENPPEGQLDVRVSTVESSAARHESERSDPAEVASDWFEGLLCQGPPKNGTSYEQFKDSCVLVDPRNTRVVIDTVRYEHVCPYDDGQMQPVESWLSGLELPYDSSGKMVVTDHALQVSGQVEDKGRRVTLTIAWQATGDTDLTEVMPPMICDARTDPGCRTIIKGCPAGSATLTLDYPAARFLKP